MAQSLTTASITTLPGVINGAAFDLLTARLDQSRATLSVLADATSGDEIPAPAVIASVAWAVDTLLQQAQEAVAAMQGKGVP